MGRSSKHCNEFHASCSAFRRRNFPHSESVTLSSSSINSGYGPIPKGFMGGWYFHLHTCLIFTGIGIMYNIDKYTSLMDLPGIVDRKSWTFFLHQKNRKLHPNKNLQPETTGAHTFQKSQMISLLHFLPSSPIPIVSMSVWQIYLHEWLIFMVS